MIRKTGEMEDSVEAWLKQSQSVSHTASFREIVQRSGRLTRLRWLSLSFANFIEVIDEVEAKYSYVEAKYSYTFPQACQ